MWSLEDLEYWVYKSIWSTELWKRMRMVQINTVLGDKRPENWWNYWIYMHGDIYSWLIGIFCLLSFFPHFFGFKIVLLFLFPKLENSIGNITKKKICFQISFLNFLVKMNLGVYLCVEKVLGSPYQPFNNLYHLVVIP